MGDQFSAETHTLFEFQPPAWQAQANCLPDRMPDGRQALVEHPLDLFFPEGKGSPTSAWKRQIALTCDACPVQVECLQHGLAHEEHGWWGGVSAAARERTRKAQQVSLRTPEIDRRTMKVIGTFIEPGHGTQQRWRRHLTEDERPCSACRDAHYEFSR